MQLLAVTSPLLARCNSAQTAKRCELKKIKTLKLNFGFGSAIFPPRSHCEQPNALLQEASARKQHFALLTTQCRTCQPISGHKLARLCFAGFSWSTLDLPVYIRASSSGNPFFAANKYHLAPISAKIPRHYSIALFYVVEERCNLDPDGDSWTVLPSQSKNRRNHPCKCSFRANPSSNCQILQGW